MKDNQTLIFISDVHSQHQKLESAIVWCCQEFSDPYFCFLGDIFDSRLDNHEKNYPPYSDSVATFWLVKNALLNGVLIQSNHQDKLRRWLHHHLNSPEKKNPVTVNYGLNYTLSQLVEPLTIEEKWELHDWLVNLPYHIVLNSYDLIHNSQISFLCSHAYFNIAAANFSEPSSRHKQEALYGLLDRDNKRVDWWSSDEPIYFYDSPAVRIAGHYHVNFKGKNQRVIDSGCGSTGGYLCVHIPAYGLYQEF